MPRRLYILLSLAAVVAGCGGTDSALRIDRGTPIVLISVDTLRSDRLPAYGYERVETPAFAALREDSILFEHAYCPVPLTFPSHASLLTGLLPSEHQVRDNIGYRLDSRELPWLPRELKSLGYRTGAAVSSFVLRGSSGLGDSFDFFDDTIESQSWSNVAIAQRSGDLTLERALEWLRTVRDEPFFLFFHIYEPHTPHEPPEPFASRYASAYDGEVAVADAIIGRFLEGLKSLGAYERSLIFLISDHGEGLNDHGDYEHGPLLYREVLQIPMMLKLPAGERGGTSVEAGAQLTDIFPTVMELLGEETPAGLGGSSLLALDGDPAAERPIYGETLYPRLHFGWSELFSIVRYPYHLIYGPDPELYDLEADPGETVNLFAERRQVSTELRRALRAHDLSVPAPAEVDSETRGKLAALGYVGGGWGETSGTLADPKARLGVLELLRQAVRQSEAGRPREAAASFRRIVAEEPGMVDAWMRLGDALTQIGELEDAVGAYERALELSGGSAQVAVSAAGGYLKLGRLKEARERAELAVNIHDMARDLLGQIALREGDLEEAERHIELAVAERGVRTSPLVTQAKLRVAQERFEDAVELTLEAERELEAREHRDGLPGLYFIRGRAYAMMAEADKAAAAFQREIELFPSELAPHTHLAFLYALQNDGARAGSTLRRMVEMNSHPRAYAEAVRTLRAMGDPQSAAAVLQIALGRWPDDAELRSL